MANIYVGNLPYAFTQDELLELFKPYGLVKYVRIVTDRESGRSKGFGFVDMDMQAVGTAIAALHDKELLGRRLVVNEAKPKVGGADTGKPWPRLALPRHGMSGDMPAKRAMDRY